MWKVKGGVILVRFGSGLIILAVAFWVIGYFAVFFQSFIMFISAITMGAIGAIILFIGVLRERLKDKKEEEENDYSQY